VLVTCAALEAFCLLLESTRGFLVPGEVGGLLAPEGLGVLEGGGQHLVLCIWWCHWRGKVKVVWLLLQLNMLLKEKHKAYTIIDH